MTEAGLEDHVGNFTEAERDQIMEAVNVLHNTRRTIATSVHLGMPTAPPAGNDPRDVKAAGR